MRREDSMLTVAMILFTLVAVALVVMFGVGWDGNR